MSVNEYQTPYLLIWHSQFVLEFFPITRDVRPWRRWLPKKPTMITAYSAYGSKGYLDVQLTEQPSKRDWWDWISFAYDYLFHHDRIGFEEVPVILSVKQEVSYQTSELTKHIIAELESNKEGYSYYGADIEQVIKELYKKKEFKELVQYLIKLNFVAFGYDHERKGNGYRSKWRKWYKEN